MAEEPHNLARARVMRATPPSQEPRPRQPMPGQLSVSLRDARLRAGLTQRQVAEQVGISQQMVAAMELGTRWPGVKTAPRLVQVLRLDGATARGLLDHAQPNRRKRQWVRRGKRAGWRLAHLPELVGRKAMARIDRASGRRGKGGRPMRRQRFTRR